MAYFASSPEKLLGIAPSLLDAFLGLSISEGADVCACTLTRPLPKSWAEHRVLGLKLTRDLNTISGYGKSARLLPSIPCAIPPSLILHPQGQFVPPGSMQTLHVSS